LSISPIAEREGEREIEDLTGQEEEEEEDRRGAV